VSALGDVIVDALRELLRVLFTPIRSVIETHGDAIVRTVVGTPAPDVVFGRPTNGAWPGIYDYYWETMLPLALFVWALSIGLVILFESMSYVFSGHHRSKLKRRAFSGLLGILMWWWVAALSLQFVGALTGYLVPDLSEVVLFETLSFGAMGVLGIVITLSADLVLFVLLGLIYFVRQMALYLYVLLVPLLIALWVPGVGPFGLVAGLMRRLAKFYVPFLFMTVPVALLFRVGELLGESFALTAGGLGAWLTALVVPLLAVVSPLVLFWQAGTLFSMTGRVSRRVSTRQARQRATRTGKIGHAGARGGRNFARGVRGSGAAGSGGDTGTDAGNSRANRVGRRLRSNARDSATGLRERVAGASDESGERGASSENGRDSGSASDARGGGTPASRPAERSGPGVDRSRSKSGTDDTSTDDTEQATEPTLTEESADDRREL
jgi:hypothetical protein